MAYALAARAAESRLLRLLGNREGPGGGLGYVNPVATENRWSSGPPGLVSIEFYILNTSKTRWSGRNSSGPPGLV